MTYIFLHNICLESIRKIFVEHKYIQTGSWKIINSSNGQWSVDFNDVDPEKLQQAEKDDQQPPKLFDKQKRQ